MSLVARFVGQNCGNFLLKELKFRRHVCSLEDFSSWVWIAFPSEKAIQMSSCTYLITVFQAVTALIIVLIIASSSCPSIADCTGIILLYGGREQEDLIFFIQS